MNKYKEKVLVENFGNFSVYNQFSRNYLYYNSDKVAECINGDYVERFGGLDGWIAKVNKRIIKRINTINSQIKSLKEECTYLESILSGE